MNLSKISLFRGGLYSLIILIALLILAGWFFVEKGRDLQIQQIKDQDIDQLKIEFSGAVEASNNQADLVFDNFINTPEIREILKKGLLAETSGEKASARGELYQRLLPLYENLRNQGIKQLHFHTPDNYSFLRMHRPDRYGDDLKGVRPSVQRANATNRKVCAFEEGRIFNGYRHVYPLEGEIPLGTVEISVSIETLTSRMNRIFQGYYGVFIFKEVVMEKVWQEEQANYVPSLLYPDFQEEDNPFSSLSPEDFSLSFQTVQQVFLSMAQGGRYDFSQPGEHWLIQPYEDTPYVLTMIPLTNLTNQRVGYIYSLREGGDVNNINQIFDSRSLFLGIGLGGYLLLAGLLVLALHGLQLSGEQLENLIKSQKTFFASVSHELRAPLSGMIGLIDIVREERDNQEKRDHFLHLIKGSAMSTLGIINDILEVAKFEDQGVSLVSEEVNLQDFLEEVALFFQPQIKQKGLDFRWSISEDLPHWIISDSLRLRQLVTNLLSNALKFTKKGHIDLRLSKSLEGDHPFLIIEVSDSGQGIRQENQERIFKEFQQVKAQRSRGFEGTGLGLAIVQNILNAMGGDLCLDSELGRGSTFTLQIPLKEGNNREEQGGLPSGRVNFQGKKVIFADDSEINRVFFQELLTLMGFEVTLAENGLTLVKLREESQPDLILMDIRMPLLGGEEAALRIRQWEQMTQTPRVTLVALTGDSEFVEKEQSRESSFDGAILKPVKRDTLTEILAGFFEGRREVQNRVDREIPFIWEMDWVRDLDFVEFSLVRLQELFQDKETLRILYELLEIFKEDTLSRLKELCRRGKWKDQEALIREAHSLKSACYTIGLEGIGKVMENLEKFPKKFNRSPYFRSLERRLPSVKQEVQLLMNVFD